MKTPSLLVRGSILGMALLSSGPLTACCRQKVADSPFKNVTLCSGMGKGCGIGAGRNVSPLIVAGNDPVTVLATRNEKGELVRDSVLDYLGHRYPGRTVFGDGRRKKCAPSLSVSDRTVKYDVSDRDAVETDWTLSTERKFDLAITVDVVELVKELKAETSADAIDDSPPLTEAADAEAPKETETSPEARAEDTSENAEPTEEAASGETGDSTSESDDDKKLTGVVEAALKTAKEKVERGTMKYERKVYALTQDEVESRIASCPGGDLLSSLAVAEVSETELTAKLAQELAAELIGKLSYSKSLQAKLESGIRNKLSQNFKSSWKPQRVLLAAGWAYEGG